MVRITEDKRQDKDEDEDDNEEGKNDNDEDEDYLILYLARTSLFVPPHMFPSHPLQRDSDPFFYIRIVTTWTKTIPSLSPPFVEWLSPPF